MNNSKNSTSKESKDPGLKLLLKSIGILLVTLRKSLGYTNARLFAELNNIDPGQLGKYERGQSNMQIGSLLKVFKLYGLTEADIFNAKILNNPTEQNLLSATVKEIKIDKVRDEVSLIDKNVLTTLQLERIITTLIFCLKPRTRKAILNYLGLTRNTENYLNNIEIIVNEGWIEMTIADKPNSRNQQYIITKKGRHVLQQ